MRKLNSNLAYFGITCLFSLASCSALNKDNKGIKQGIELERDSWIRYGIVSYEYNKAISEGLYYDNEIKDYHGLLLNCIMNGNEKREKRLEYLEQIEIDIQGLREKKNSPKPKGNMRV